MTAVGFIGTGHLTSFLVEGLKRAGADHTITVSPRNRKRAAALKQRFSVAVAADNQAVVNAADVVLVCVRPGEGEAVLAPLRFRPDHLVISAMAAVPRATVARLARPAHVVVAMMPGHANALGQGPVAIHPADEAARSFFSPLGPVHAYDDEATFRAASAFGGFSGMSFSWMKQLVDWFIAHGLEVDDARRLVAETLKGNAEVLLADAAPLDDLIAGIATPGGLTELGNRILEEGGATAAWQAALDAVGDRAGGR